MILMLEKDDPKVLELRKQIFVEDLDMPVECMDLSHSELKSWCDDVEHFENAWKMSNTMWNSKDIDKVWLIPNVGLSCGMVYDETRYRAGYLTYTLKDKRAKYRSLNFKEFGFMARQCIRALELNKEEIFITVYEYNKRMSAQIRAYKHKGYADKAGNILHQDLEYRGIENINSLDQHVFSIRFEDMYEKYDDDLMQLKNDETSPIVAKYPTDVKKYPDVLKLCNVDVEPLVKDLYDFDDNENYLLTRRKDFVLSPSVNAIVSNYLGFTGSVYESVPLNKKNSRELKEHLGESTKSFLNTFQGAERCNYVTTRKGWKTKEHEDHKDYTDQGFRVIVPLTGPMKMTFEGEREYIFEPGYAYFTNVCIPHVGEHYSDQEERTGILFKLNNDEMIWQAYTSA